MTRLESGVGREEHPRRWGVQGARMGRWRAAKACVAVFGLGLGLALGCRAAVPERPPLLEATALPGFDPAALADGRPAELGPLPPLVVRDYGPEGVMDGEPIRVRFNQAVVDVRAENPAPLAVWVIGEAGEPARAVPGQARWTSPNALEWEPDDPLVAATRFEARFGGGLVNREGSRVEGVSWQFETARPTVRWLEDWEPVAVDAPLYVLADQPMRAEALAEHLRVMAPVRAGEEARALPVRVRAIGFDELPPYWRSDLGEEDAEQGTIFAIAPRDRWPAGARARLEIDAELRGEAGPLPLGEPHAAKLRFRDVLRVRGLSCEQRRGRSCEPGWLQLRLSNELAEGEIARIEVSPRPKDLEVWSSYDYGYDDEDDAEVDEGEDEDGEEDEEDDGGVIITLAGDFSAGQRHRITVPASLTDAHGQTLGRRYRTTVSIREAAPELEEDGEASLSLSSRGGTFVRPEDARVGILGHHVQQARIRVAVLEPQATRALLQAEDLGAAPWPSAATTTVVLRTLTTRGSEAWSQEVLSLADFAGPGDAVLVELEPETLTPRGRMGSQPEPVRGLFQISDLGAVVDLGPARGMLWVTRASEGTPWAGVEAEVHTPAGTHALPRSDADGLVPLPGALALGDDAVAVLRDSGSGERLVLPLHDYRWRPSRGSVHASWPMRGIREHRGPMAKREEALPEGLVRGEQALVAVQVGRGIYLPGDTVHAAGWAGIATPHRDVSTRRVKAGTPVELELRLDDEVVASLRVRVNRHGRFSGSLAVPSTAALGRYELRATMLESHGATWLLVADARVPTFEIAARTSRRSVIRGETVELLARAQSLSGEPAPMEQLRWVLHCSAGWFRPEGYDRPWTFGPMRWDPSDARHGTVTPEVASARIAVTLGTEELDPMRLHDCHVSVAGQDVSFQEVGAETGSFEVHPARAYVGLRPPQEVVAGQRAEVMVDAVDTRGRRVALSGVELVVMREPERDPRMAEEPPAVEVARCRVDVAEAGERPGCAVAKVVAGYHRVTATAVVDGVPIETGTDFVVHEPPPPSKPDAKEPTSTGSSPTPTAAATPERRFEIVGPEEAPVGRPIELRITAPWDEGRGVLTVTQTGLREALPFVLREGEATVSVTPRAGRGPRLELQASVARPGVGHELPSIARRNAWVQLHEPRALEVTIAAPERGRPRETVPLRVSVRDHEGAPVDARVAVWVVDDGLHQLREPYPAQLEVIFDPDRPGDRQRTLGHASLLRPFVPWGFGGRGKRVPRVRQAKAQVKGAMDVEVRQRFEAVPLFVGDVGTGPDGEVALTLTLPDDLTRFRISAIASAELDAKGLGRAVEAGSGPARFGRGTAELEVSVPLVVRAALPRVLRPGDTAEVAALVTPPSERAGTVVVEASLREAEGVLALRGPVRRRVEVDGTRPVRVAFDVEALGPGEPAVRLVARFEPKDGSPLRGGVERRFGVEVERTQVERAAIYGRLDRDGPAAIPVLLPEGVRADHGGLTVSLRSTALGDLDEAAQYLVRYPHGCLEQTASRLLPLVALGELADRLPEGVEDPEAFVADTLAHLLSMQLADGSFGYWPGSDGEAPHAAAYATWVLQLAAEAGVPVPRGALERAQRALLERLERPLPDRRWDREDARALRAMAVHALVRGGHGEAAAVDTALGDLYDHRDGLPVFAQALVLMALHGIDPADPRVAVMQRRLSSAIEPLPGHAHVVTTDGSRYAWLFDSPARSQAMTLLALLQVTPDDPIVDDLARGLVQQRHAGRWRNTQENAYSLLAMAGYARVREAAVPDHRVEAWIGPRRALTVEHRGRDREASEVTLPMAALLGPVGTDRTTHVVLDRQGEGPLHYRVGLEWAGSGPAPVRSQGLSLQRTLLHDGQPLPAEAELTAGQRYAIEVVVETEAPQHYLAIEVPLPAGVEAIDTRLGRGIEARISALEHGAGWWTSHEELRRDRVVLFADELPPGRHVHTIHVLATTPGRYVLPAAVAEAMYTPEVRARTTAGRVRVTGR